METQEYEDGTVPHHVANFFRMQRKEQVARILEKEWIIATLYGWWTPPSYPFSISALASILLLYINQ